MKARNLEQQVVGYLIKKAMLAQTVHYVDIAKEFSLSTEGAAMSKELTPILYAIFLWCRQNKMPPLTFLVVRKGGDYAGQPGPGLWNAMFPLQRLNRAERSLMTRHFQEEIFKYWQVSELSQSVADAVSRGEEM